MHVYLLYFVPEEFGFAVCPYARNEVQKSSDICMLTSRPVARIDCGEVRDAQKVDLLDPKSGLFGPQPP